MASACAESLLTALSQVSDPRGRKGRRHPLAAMLTAVVCGLLCGNRGYTALAEWLHDLPVDVWHWTGYTRCLPKQDCFRDLLIKLDPDALEEVLRTWITGTLGLETDPEALPAVGRDCLLALAVPGGMPARGRTASIDQRRQSRSRTTSKSS